MKKPEYIKISNNDGYAIYKSSSDKTHKYKRIFNGRDNIDIYYDYYVVAINGRYTIFDGCWNKGYFTYRSKNAFKVNHLTEEEVFLEML